MNELKTFLQEEDGIGVVEIVLILIVLVGLVVMFKKEINTIMSEVLSRVSQSAKEL